MDPRRIFFRKMNGLGNDFVVIDARADPVALSPAQAARIADRATGVGCDQVILLEPSPSADVFMRILNADGSEVAACGNATRCIAALIEPELGRREVTIETAAGVLSATVGESGSVTVDMGLPRFHWHEIPLACPFPDTRAIDLEYRLPDGRVLNAPSVVNVGNPHCIFWVSDVESYDLASIGPTLERHPLFPERANISLAEILSGTRIKLRVWERGAGLTRACGTAACAAAVAAARLGSTGRRLDVALPGGILAIDWRDDDHILMSGPVEFEFEGILNLNSESSAAHSAVLS